MEEVEPRASHLLQAGFGLVRPFSKKLFEKVVSNRDMENNSEAGGARVSAVLLQSCVFPTLFMNATFS